MDLDDVARWCRENGHHAPAVHGLEVATLPGHRLSWNYRSWARRGAACNVMASPHHRVWGLCLTVDDAALAALDEKEGDAYHRTRRGLRTLEDRPRDAWVYEVKPHRREPADIAPRAHYLGLVIASAERHGFPPAYLDGLRAIVPLADDE